MSTPFDIKRVDPLGQGVSLTDTLEGEKVTFIPKTLPGEKGFAKIHKKKGKKVQFAHLIKVDQISPERITPSCPHFTQCRGCSYLHTSYENETNLKKDAYSFLFKSIFPQDKIQYIKAPERLGYRNRIQLHYDQNSLGFQNQEGIHEIPKCLLPHPFIQEKLQELYELKLKDIIPRNAPSSGHLELSLEEIAGEKEVKIYFNQNYSAGGFRQVNEAMGKDASLKIAAFALTELSENSNEEKLLIDLFGGSGYLSQFHNGKKLIFDYGQQRSENPNFIDINLYGKQAPQKFEKSIKKFNFQDLKRVLIVDPPRSGLKNLSDFTSKTEAIIYLSCNPHSQVRDIKSLIQNGGWKLEKVEFLDFFPATHHLESLCLLKRVKS